MINHRQLVCAVAVVASSGLLAACGSDDPAGDSGTRVQVTATDTECTVAPATVEAGTVTFEISNEGSVVTEFYLYAEGDEIVSEAEDIGPGLRRELVVDVPDAGSYETACKPGMEGDGIRGAFTVS